jgi:hypothetical protein
MLMFDAVLSAPHMPPGIGLSVCVSSLVVIVAKDSQHLLNPAAAASFKATAENVLPNHCIFCDSVILC